MKNNEKKYLFFNKRIVMIVAATMMMGQLCFVTKYSQGTVQASKRKSSIGESAEDLGGGKDGKRRLRNKKDKSDNEKNEDDYEEYNDYEYRGTRGRNNAPNPDDKYKRNVKKLGEEKREIGGYKYKGNQKNSDDEDDDYSKKSRGSISKVNGEGKGGPYKYAKDLKTPYIKHKEGKSNDGNYFHVGNKEKVKFPTGREYDPADDVNYEIKFPEIENQKGRTFRVNSFKDQNKLTGMTRKLNNGEIFVNVEERAYQIMSNVLHINDKYVTNENLEHHRNKLEQILGDEATKDGMGITGYNKDVTMEELLNGLNLYPIYKGRTIPTLKLGTKIKEEINALKELLREKGALQPEEGNEEKIEENSKQIKYVLTHLTIDLVMVYDIAEIYRNINVLTGENIPKNLNDVFKMMQAMNNYSFNKVLKGIAEGGFAKNIMNNASEFYRYMINVFADTIIQWVYCVMDELIVGNVEIENGKENIKFENDDENYIKKVNEILGIDLGGIETVINEYWNKRQQEARMKGDHVEKLIYITGLQENGLNFDAYLAKQLSSAGRKLANIIIKIIKGGRRYRFEYPNNNPDIRSTNSPYGRGEFYFELPAIYDPFNVKSGESPISIPLRYSGTQMFNNEEDGNLADEVANLSSQERLELVNIVVRIYNHAIRVTNFLLKGIGVDLDKSTSQDKDAQKKLLQELQMIKTANADVNLACFMIPEDEEDIESNNNFEACQVYWRITLNKLASEDIDKIKGDGINGGYGATANNDKRKMKEMRSMDLIRCLHYLLAGVGIVDDINYYLYGSDINEKKLAAQGAVEEFSQQTKIHGLAHQEKVNFPGFFIVPFTINVLNSSIITRSKFDYESYFKTNKQIYDMIFGTKIERHNAKNGVIGYMKDGWKKDLFKIRTLGADTEEEDDDYYDDDDGGIKRKNLRAPGERKKTRYEEDDDDDYGNYSGEYPIYEDDDLNPKGIPISWTRRIDPNRINRNNRDRNRGHEYLSGDIDLESTRGRRGIWHGRKLLRNLQKLDLRRNLTAIDSEIMRRVMDEIIDTTTNLDDLFSFSRDNENNINYTLNLLMMMYITILKIPKEQFNGGHTTKLEILTVMKEKIEDYVKRHKRKLGFTETDIGNVLTNIGDKSLANYTAIVYLRPFVRISADEIDQIGNGMEGMQNKKFAEIIRKIVKSNDSEINKIRDKQLDDIKKEVANACGGILVANNLVYRKSTIKKELEMIFENVRVWINKIYNETFEQLKIDIVEGQNQDHKMLLNSIISKEGNATTIESIRNIDELIMFARKTADYYKGLAEYWQKRQDNTIYSFAFARFGNRFGSGIKDVETMLFEEAKNIWSQLHEKLADFKKMRNNKNGYENEERLKEKLRGIMLDHVNRLMRFLEYFPASWTQEKTEWDNLAKLIKTAKEGSKENEKEEDYLAGIRQKLEEGINAIVEEISESLNYGNLEDINRVISMLDSDNTISDIFGRPGIMTKRMAIAMENIRKAIRDLGNGNNNSDFGRQATGCVQKIMLYEILQFIFSKTLFSKEYALLNFDFRTGKNDKDETEINKEVDLKYTKGQKPFVMFKETMFKLLEDMIAKDLYKGLFNTYYLDRFDGYMNEKELTIQTMKKFMENAMGPYTELEKCYGGDMLKTEEATSSDEETADTDEEDKDEDDLKEKKAVTTEATKIVDYAKGWMTVSPFKNNNLALSETKLRAKIDYEGRSASLELHGLDPTLLAGNPNMRVVVRVIMNNKVIDAVTEMTRRADNVLTCEIKLPEVPKNRVSFHLYYKDKADGLLITQLKEGHFICGIDMLNLTDIGENQLKSARSTTAEFHTGRGSNEVIEGPQVMKLYKIGNKILGRIENLDCDGLVLTILADKDLVQGENRTPCTKLELEKQDKIWYFVIEENIASQIGDKFSIHFHRGEQKEDKFVFHALVNFNETQSKKDDADEVSKDKEKSKRDELEIELDEEEADEEDGKSKKKKSKSKDGKAKKDKNKMKSKKKGKAKKDQKYDDDDSTDDDDKTDDVSERLKKAGYKEYDAKDDKKSGWLDLPFNIF